MKIGFKQMLAEFKTFAFKGSLIDLAVAVVIGAAFGGVIKALVDDIIMPSVSYVVTAASAATEVATKAAKEAGSAVGVTSKPSTTQPGEAVAPAIVKAEESKPAPPAPAAEKPSDKAVNFEWMIGRIKIGHFIGELINFVIIALAVFLIVVKLLGSVMKKVGGTPAASEVTTKECPKCLSVIPIKASKCAHCTADL